MRKGLGFILNEHILFKLIYDQTHVPKKTSFRLFPTDEVLGLNTFLEFLTFLFKIEKK